MQVKILSLPLKLWVAVIFLTIGNPITAVFAKNAVNADADGVMLHGYDPVVYHHEFEPKKGRKDYQYRYNGGVYYFISEQNRNRFIADSERYAPAYGGYCAYGVRVGKKFDIDPNAWLIVDDRLFLQLNQGTHLLWEKDLTNNIEIADKIWPKIKAVPAAELK